MSVISINGNSFTRTHYSSEAELEATILKLQTELFGAGRIYLDVKKKIGLKGGQRNIPDGYLVDLSGRQPRLYVVETELAAHDQLRHIAVQILQFSLSFESEPRVVKSIVFNALQAQPEAFGACEAYALTHGFRNLDHMLEWLVFESPFAALVVIDEMPEALENVLARRFQFGVEVLEIARYADENGAFAYQFEPFLADLTVDIIAAGKDVGVPRVEAGEVDTVVVAARADGFADVFLGEDRWYAIRIHGTMRPQIKYIAAYQVAPVSAITHIAPVRSIEPWKDNKFVLNFSEPAREIGPIKLTTQGHAKAPQAPRYTTKERLEAATTLDEVW